MSKVDFFQTLGVLAAIVMAGTALKIYWKFQRCRMKIVKCVISNLENKALVFELIITNPSLIPFAMTDIYLKYRSSILYPLPSPITIVESDDERYIFTKYRKQGNFKTIHNFKDVNKNYLDWRKIKSKSCISPVQRRCASPPI